MASQDLEELKSSGDQTLEAARLTVQHSQLLLAVWILHRFLAKVCTAVLLKFSFQFAIF